MNKGYSVVLLLSVMMCSAKKAPGIVLNKCFHNRATDVSAELGSVVCYFSAEPEIIMLPEEGGSKKKTISYFFNNVKLGPEAQTMLKTFTQQHRGYSISIEPMNSGVKLMVYFDPEVVDVKAHDAQFYITHDRQQGFVLRLKNKKPIQQPLLKTVYALPKKVVIDCGHGGTDTGTLGCGIACEKKIALDVGLQVATLLKQEGFDVLLTRMDDRSVALDERTTLANMNNADLFISIHANYAPSSAVSGIETLCLTDALFKPCFGKSGLFTATSMSDTMNDTRIRNKTSQLLAYHLQDAVVSHIKKKHPHIVNRGIKHAATQVLVGTTMPAVLIEIGFLSNWDEATLLSGLSDNAAYQKMEARGICEGVKRFFYLA